MENIILATTLKYDWATVMFRSLKRELSCSVKCPSLGDTGAKKQTSGQFGCNICHPTDDQDAKKHTDETVTNMKLNSSF